ncbi:MAG TPA: helix-turn-helix domain-containing protein [Polyangiaceae bacterium]|nr:helix-turn-helix domain-containing protein [Polyangiaceae bacterium]
MRNFPMVSASSIGACVRYVAQQAGCSSVESVLRHARLPLEMAGVAQHDGRFIPLRSLFLLLEAASDAAKTRDFGVKLVQARGLASAGSLFLDAERTLDLGAALESACRASRAYSNHWHFEIEGCGDFRRIGLATSLGASRGARQLTELLLAGLVSLMRRFAGDAWHPVRIETDHAIDASTGAGLELFAGCQLIHGKATAGVVIDEAVWQRRTSHALERHPRPPPLLAPPDDFTSAVRELIRICLLDADCSLLLVARTMGVSARTLQRELNRSGCTFRRLVVSERCARAAELLVETRSAIGDIALSSGYSSHNHLARAFKSLELLSPGQYRSRMGKAKAC